MIKIIYLDEDIIVCIKPSGALSTDEPGGMPYLLREQLNSPKMELYTVHRLDRVASGLIVYARNSKSASILSKEITEHKFKKEYLAVVHGEPDSNFGRYDDLLFRDTSKNMTFVVNRMRKGVREASLEYEVLESTEGLSLVKINLLTGRTHQIRVQFSSRQMPLAGDKKYGAAADKCAIALWSHCLEFTHPNSNKKMLFCELPGAFEPWIYFDKYITERTSDEIELSDRKNFRESLIGE